MASIILKHVAILHYDTHQIHMQGNDKYYTDRRFMAANNSFAFIERFRGELIPPALLEAGTAPWRDMCWGLYSDAPHRVAGQGHWGVISALMAMSHAAPCVPAPAR